MTVASELPGAPRTDRYLIEAKIGEGAMGLVFRGRERETNQTVAIKTLRTHSAEELFRLKREFRELAELRHPNLVELFDLYVDGGACFFSMEWIDGWEFLEFARRQVEHGPAGFDRIREAIRQLARGLDALHKAEKLHRDIKPGNVLVDRSGRVVLLDFG